MEGAIAATSTSARRKREPTYGTTRAKTSTATVFRTRGTDQKGYQASGTLLLQVTESQAFQTLSIRGSRVVGRTNAVFLTAHTASIVEEPCRVPTSLVSVSTYSAYG